MAKNPAVGDDAPDFELEGTQGTFKLSEQRGKKVLLLFYPGDETSVCTKQFCSYRDNAEAFGSLGVTAVGISGKDVESKRRFAEKNDLGNVPLLADPNFEVAKAYDAYAGLMKMAKRSVIVVDEQGKVAHRHDHALGLGFQTVADLKRTLDELPSRSVTQLRVPARFNGPPGSANGGYTCGLVAGLLDGGACEVSLTAPPPLERALAVEREDEDVVVRNGQTMVARGRQAELDLSAGAAVSAEEASEASAAGLHRWAAGHPFPTCVVCGPDRDPGDGFGIFPAPLGDGTRRFAASWQPHDSLSASDGTVRQEFVWAALDCPTSAPLANYGEGPPIVLARLAASLDAPVAAGERNALVSWELARDGRKREAACVLFDDAGRTLARARALWIELRKP